MIRILHVDDEKDAQELIEFNLRKHAENLRIEHADSCQIALEMLASREYNCLICDYMMPEMDGLQLLRTIREAGNDLPFILLTCQGNEEIAAEAFRAGADDYYTKEVGFAHYDRMANSIQRIVEAKAQRDERKRADEKIRHLNLVLKAIRNVNQLITSESDIDKILKGACESLIETRGYRSAWIALLDEAGSSTKTTGAGVGKNFTLLENYLQAGKLVSCVQESLRQPGVVARVKTEEACGDCRFLNLEAEQGSMTVRLEHKDRVYGVLTVTIPSPLVMDKEERSLFNEVAGDISLALHRNEIEEKRKRAEEALRKSEEWFRALTESTSDWIWEVDASGTYTYVGPKAKDLLGYEPDEIVGTTPFDLMPPQEAERVAAVFREIVESRKPIVRLENTNLHKDGREIVLETSGVPVFDTDGRLSGYRGVDRDITDRKRSEKVQESIYQISEAANSALDLQELFSSIHGIIGELMPAENFYIALYDHSSDMLSFPYFADQFDETPAPKKPGKGLTEYVLRTGRSLLATPDVFDRLVEKGEVESLGAPSIDWLGVPLRAPEEAIGVLVVQTYTKGIRYGEEEKKILEFVSTQAAMAIERKRVEEALRRREDEYRTLNNQLPIGVYRTTAEGKFLHANPALADILEYESVEDLKKVSASKTYGDPNVREDQLAQWRESEGIVSSVIRLKTKKGKSIWVQDTGRIILDENGEIDYIDGTIEEITERKQADEALRTAYELLEQERNMFVAGPVVVFRWKNQEGWPVEYVSSNVKAVLGYSAEEFESGQVLYNEIIPKEDMERVTEEAREGTESGAERFEHKPYRLVRKDGKTIWVADYTTILRDEAGRITHYLGYIIDISKRK